MEKYFNLFVQNRQAHYSVFIITCLLCIACLTHGQIHNEPQQVFAKPLAQYPLDLGHGNDEEKSGTQVTVVKDNFRVYDVSGKGRHGRFVNSSNKPLTSVFHESGMFNQTTVFEKRTRDKAWIEVPDPFENYDISDGFTISFWMYWNASPENLYKKDVLLSIPGKGICIKRHENAFYISANIDYQKALSNGLSFRVLPTNPAQSDWFFVCIRFDRNNVTISVCKAQNFSEERTAFFTASEIWSSVSFDKSFIPKKGVCRLFDPQCAVKLWNVKFYHGVLTDAQVNEDRILGWYWSKAVTNFAAAADLHVNRGTALFYPLNQYNLIPAITVVRGDMVEIMRQKNAIGTIGDINYITNRFHSVDKAVKMAASNSGFKLPPFFEGYDETQGFTISYWTNIETPLSSFAPHLPFTQSDLQYQIFYGKDLNNKLLFGNTRIRERLSINRYIPTNPIKTWNLWLWDQVDFNAVTGWYHVIMVQDKNMMTTYMRRYNRQSDGTASRRNYFVAQSLKNVVHWGLGNDSGASIESLDDFRIYYWPMTDVEAEALMTMEESKDLADSFKQ